ncbi:MAG: hypothetical protein Q9P44_09305 [Anaerolineae bacterium]|nr:hypothetical protein [Anaerolineae bacterium]
MLNRKLWGVLFLVAAIMLFSSALTVRTYACSPTPEALEYTLEDRIENAPLVLVGTVLDGTIGWGNTIVEAEIKVDSYLKGSGMAVVTISGFGDGADCRSRVQMGGRYIFFAEGDSADTLQAVYLGVQDATYSASDERVSRVTAFTGQSLEPQPLPIYVQLQRLAREYATVSMGIVGLAVLLLIAGLMKRRMILTRKPKAKRG